MCYNYTKKCPVYLVVYAAINSVSSRTISVGTVALSNSFLKARIGFALRFAEPLNGFLKALLGIPLTPWQGVDLSLW